MSLAPCPWPGTLHTVFVVQVGFQKSRAGLEVRGITMVFKANQGEGNNEIYRRASSLSAVRDGGHERETTCIF